MSDLVTIAEWSGQPSACAIFVPGLGGHVYTTWGDPNADLYWPRWLAQDVQGLRVYSLSYEAPPTNWLGTAMPLQDQAANILERLLSRTELRQQPLVFVCHSLGGLLVKQIILDLNEQRTSRPGAGELLDRIQGVVFIATPHTGSRKATWLDRLKILAWPSSVTRTLVTSDPTLRKLNVSYRGFADQQGLSHLVFYETQGTVAGSIVDEASSDPGLPHSRPIPIDADHVSICKPRDRSNLVAEMTKDFVSKIANPLSAPDSKFTRCVLRPYTRPTSHGLFVPRLARLLVLGVLAYFGIRLAAVPPQTTSGDVRDAVGMATQSPKIEGQVAGISRLSVAWRHASEEDLVVITRTLTDLLQSDSERVRQAAADAIGNAYDESTPAALRHTVKRLLYGSADDWYVGSVTKLNLDLQRDETRFAPQLAATREAIRKNWEDLQGVHLRGTSLIAAELYEANLQGAYMKDADLRCANLESTDMTGAMVDGVKWGFANVKALKPADLRAIALKQGAVSMETEEWIKARRGQCPVGETLPQPTIHSNQPQIPVQSAPTIVNLTARATIRYSCPNTRPDAKPEAGWIQCDQIPSAAAPQEAQLTWSSPVTITKVELAIEQSPNGDTEHILMVNDVEAKRFTQYTFHRRKLVFVPPAPISNVWTLTIKTVKSPSWWAWGGFEILGY